MFRLASILYSLISTPGRYGRNHCPDGRGGYASGYSGGGGGRGLCWQRQYRGWWRVSSTLTRFERFDLRVQIGSNSRFELTRLFRVQPVPAPGILANRALGNRPRINSRCSGRT